MLLIFWCHSQLSIIKSKENRNVSFWPSNGSVTLSLRSRSKLFGVSVSLTMDYLLCKFHVPTKKKRLRRITIAKTKASPKVLGEAKYCSVTVCETGKVSPDGSKLCKKYSCIMRQTYKVLSAINITVMVWQTLLYSVINIECLA